LLPWTGTSCKYHEEVQEGKQYHYKHSLSAAVMSAFEESESKLMSLIRKRLLKTVYVGTDTLKYGMYDAILNGGKKF
jgi:hypothetical protein